MRATRKVQYLTANCSGVFALVYRWTIVFWTASLLALMIIFYACPFNDIFIAELLTLLRVSFDDIFIHAIITATFIPLLFFCDIR
jgi:hypothetical protein